MLKDEIDLLAGQAHLFTETYMNTLKDPDDQTAFRDFISQFYSGTAQPVLVTRDELFDLQKRIHDREILVSYVFSLRLFSLSVFKRSEVKDLVESFAMANANKPASEHGNDNVLPTDSSHWVVKVNELISLYDANLWILPLFSLIFSFPGYVENEGNGPL